MDITICFMKYVRGWPENMEEAFNIKKRVEMLGLESIRSFDTVRVILLIKGNKISSC